MKRKPISERVKAQIAPSTVLRLASLALVFLTIVALGAVAYFTERGIVFSRDWVIHTYQVRSQLNDLQLDITRAQANDATFLLTRDRQQLPQSQEQSELAGQTLNKLRRLTYDNPRQQQRLAQLGQVLKEKIALIATQPRSNGISVHLSPAERERESMIRASDKTIDSIVKNMQDEEESLLEQRLKAWDYLFRRNVLMLGLAFAVVTVMLAYNFRVLVTEVARTRDTEKRIRDNAESYRLMSARILELQDSERRRIARELHDSVGQYLAGLKINLSQIETGARVDAPQLIRETIGLTDYAIQEVRTISHLLHPPLLEELGFLPAARWYVDEYGKRSQVKVSLLVDEPIERLPREVEIALFRVLQEALTNVYRHAAAQSVDVRIVCRDGHVVLTVSDDGKGIPQDVLARFRGGAAPGIGLAGMRERLAEFGGQIRVESSSGGAVLMALIPTHECKQKEGAAQAAPLSIGI
ncbi:MAG TPA: ATP-binding protein [Candidatus Sulfotelmatobacter sp.]|nr:ATP-binding protein [Candidatus Sulfotelmatobacter sp.]